MIAFIFAIETDLLKVYWVICAQHPGIDFRFSQREILRVRAWNLAWYMFNYVTVRLWSKIIEKWGTRCIFMLLKMTYILPPFWTRSVGVFKWFGKPLYQHLWDKFNTENELQWFFHIFLSLQKIEFILRLQQHFVLAPYFGHFITWKTALRPRFQIFANF